MPKYFVPTGFIVEAPSAQEAQSWVYTMARMDVNADKDVSNLREMQTHCTDYWTYDLNDPEHPVEELQ